MTAPTRRLHWYRRLEARVVAGVIVLIALSMTAVLVETTRAVTAQSLERTLGDLRAARSAFYSLADDRAEFAAAQAALVAELPVFRAHITDAQIAGDSATLEAMAEGYRQQLQAEFTIVADRNGTWTARSGWPAGTAPPPAVGRAISQATAGRPSREIAASVDRLFLVVSEPARFADELLGTLTVGYALDDGLAKRLADVTRCDVSLVSNGHVYASSLPAAGRAALTAAIAQGDWPGQDTTGSVRRVADAEYAIGVFPISRNAGTDATARLLLMQDRRPTQLFISQIQRRLLGAGAIIFVVAVGGSLLFSRRMSRPLQDLAAAAEDIAGGNWARQLPVRGSVEATMMAQAVNHMTTGLRHWYEEAKTRDDQLRQVQKLEAVGRLAGGVAHDFNNLLTAIKGYGDLLLEDLVPADPHRGDVEEILKAADRAAVLTKQLLAFSRRQVVVVRVLSLDAVVAGTDKMLRRLIGEDIKLTTSIHPDSGRVRADPSQIEQVLLNLVVNARDAMPKGGTIEIELANVVLGGAAGRSHATLAPGRYVRLSVRDTGSGMTHEVKARIFEPFFTTKEEGRGTGLGLAMVYGIVEQAGGAIDVDSEVDRGTAFHVYLPRTSEPEVVQVAEAATAPEVGRGTETVLLVEDEPRVAALIASVLERAGYVVLQAMEGDRALEIVRAHTAPIDLLLTDVVMPGMNGRELAEHVRSLRRDIRVLYMSGYSDDAILRRGVETARVNFIQKPFSMEALTVRVRETLRASSETLL